MAALQADSVSIEAGTLTLNGTVNTSSLDTQRRYSGRHRDHQQQRQQSRRHGIRGQMRPGQLTITGDYSSVRGAPACRVCQFQYSNVGVLQVNGSADLAGELIISAGPDLIADVLIADGGITGSFDSISVDGRALVAVVPSANTISIARVSTTLEDNMVEAALDNSYLVLDTLASGIHVRPGSGIWLKGLGSYGERDEVDGLPGGDYTIGGGAIGADWQISERFRIGGMFAYTSMDLDSDDNSDGSADNYSFGAFANYDQDHQLGCNLGNACVHQWATAIPIRTGGC